MLSSKKVEIKLQEIQVQQADIHRLLLSLVGRLKENEKLDGNEKPKRRVRRGAAFKRQSEQAILDLLKDGRIFGVNQIRAEIGSEERPDSSIDIALNSLVARRFINRVRRGNYQIVSR